MPKKNSETAGEPSFEDAVARLDEIVEKMEAEKLPLEELLVHYEEGVRLVKVCTEKLAAAEKRIEIIRADSSGKLQVAPFEESSKSEAPVEGEVSLF